MMKCGLLSVTFRQLLPEQIIELAVKAQLQAMEWGGDIHVPHGDVKTAARVARLTADAGLEAASYGSYYRVGYSESQGLAFESVLDAAEALQAPAIRVWAGNRGSDMADEGWWETVIKDSLRIAELAAKRGIEIHYEFHSKTLTDTNETAVKLLQATGHPNIRCNWQPFTHYSEEERLEGIRSLGGKLANLHVFYWQPGVRLPLKDGEARWSDYLEAAGEAGGSRCAMLEFVHNDDPAQFLQDAAVLRTLVSRNSQA